MVKARTRENWDYGRERETERTTKESGMNMTTGIIDGNDCCSHAAARTSAAELYGRAQAMMAEMPAETYAETEANECNMNGK